MIVLEHRFKFKIFLRQSVSEHLSSFKTVKETTKSASGLVDILKQQNYNGTQMKLSSEKSKPSLKTVSI